jgi:protein-disulfide isomerase
MIRHALIAAIAFAPVTLVGQVAQPTPPTVPGAIGSTISVITVEDTAGAVAVKPSDAPATVVIFVSAECPVSNAYNGRMNALYSDYTSKKVRFIFADANATETLAQIRKLRNRSENPLTVPTYYDANNVMADHLGAHATPEAYVIDNTGVLRYHGAIDNSKDSSQVTTQSLRNAIDAVLAGKPVQVATTRAFGCTIKRKKTA